MERIMTMVLITALVLGSCGDGTDGKSSDPEDVTIIDPVDPAFWFGEVYNELIIRVGEVDSDDYTGATGEQMGQIANVQYVCNAINAKWGAGTVTPVAGTASRVANCEYLLKMIDKANSGRTTFGTSSYATTQIVDVNAVNDAVNRLWRTAVRFVTVGYNGSMVYSTDGINWTQITVGSDIWSGITYGNGKFVAVGRGSGIAYSTDGISWTQITIGGSNYSWSGVTYGNGKFVAVGNLYSSGYSGRMAYSTDGISWTQITVGGSNYWSNVIYGNGKFVAVGDSYPNSNGSMAYSTDGISWTQITVGSTNWVGITYGNGKFVAVGGSGGIAYSTDGISWTRITVGGTLTWRGVTYGNGRWVIVGRDSDPASVTSAGIGKIAYSTDGISWTQITVGGSNYSWFDVTYGNGKFVAVGNSNNNTGGGTPNACRMAYSTDGISWTQITLGSSVAWRGISYGGD